MVAKKSMGFGLDYMGYVGKISPETYQSSENFPYLNHI
jgi:hypothetical protein